ncbi:hypothetical protein PENSPDRAFT_660244 [Peniophora sp. CONT]|nr:hypothetical protein PENSPDRAFT_660244 [Peniophora sp. CONT]
MSYHHSLSSSYNSGRYTSHSTSPSSSSSSYDSPASSSSSRYSSPGSDIGSPASSHSSSSYYTSKGSPLASNSSTSGSSSLQSIRGATSHITSQYYVNEQNSVYKTRAGVDRIGRNEPTYQLIRGDGPSPYVVIPHGIPEECICASFIQFSRLILVGGSYVRVPGLCIQDPERGLENKNSRPFANRRRIQNDRMNLHLEWPGLQLGSLNVKTDTARRVVMARGGQMTLEDLAFAVSQFVADELRRIEQYGEPSGFEQWKLWPRGSPKGMKASEITASGICELHPGHWQVILHWYPSAKDLPANK